MGQQHSSSVVTAESPRPEQVVVHAAAAAQSASSHPAAAVIGSFRLPHYDGRTSNKNENNNDEDEDEEISSPSSSLPTTPAGDDGMKKTTAGNKDDVKMKRKNTADAIVDGIPLDRRIVLLGESTHGTEEFYQTRVAITKRLIEERGFSAVVFEADWPFMERVNDFCHRRGTSPYAEDDDDDNDNDHDNEECGSDKKKGRGKNVIPRRRFPSWMWENQCMDDFYKWVKALPPPSHHTSKEKHLERHLKQQQQQNKNKSNKKTKSTSDEEEDGLIEATAAATVAAVTQSQERVSLLGMDCYSLHESKAAVISFLEEYDPDFCAEVKDRLEYIDNFKDGHAYGDAMVNGPTYSRVASHISSCLTSIQARLQWGSSRYSCTDYERLSVEQNCEVLIAADEYYRKCVSEPAGSQASWNMRDQHMTTTLLRIDAHLDNPKIVIWAHNSHIGDATATSRGGTNFERNETWNVGQMVRATFGRENVWIVGQYTSLGTVTAAQQWGGPHASRTLNAPLANSYEHHMQQLVERLRVSSSSNSNSTNNNNSSNDGYFFNTHPEALQRAAQGIHAQQQQKTVAAEEEIEEESQRKQQQIHALSTLYDILTQNPRGLLQRWVGVLYKQDTEKQSHYGELRMSDAYDQVVFIPTTSALRPIVDNNKTISEEGEESITSSSSATQQQQPQQQQQQHVSIASSRRLMKEYKRLMTNGPPDISAHPLPNNLLEWHYAIRMAKYPYEGGVYHGVLEFPPEYPLRPPAFRMLTPSGRFEVHTRLCLSMSDFHPESWNPAWSVETLLIGLQSFMYEESNAIGSISVNNYGGGGGGSTARVVAQKMLTAERIAFAKATHAFNARNRIYRELFYKKFAPPVVPLRLSSSTTADSSRTEATVAHGNNNNDDGDATPMHGNNNIDNDHPPSSSPSKRDRALSDSGSARGSAAAGEEEARQQQQDQQQQRHIATTNENNVGRRNNNKSPEERRMSPTTRANAANHAANNASSGRACRFCLTGDDETPDEPLIAPCKCKGSNKWVHLSCLRAWQKEVLCTQSTHPKYQTSIDRVCNVCLEPFTGEGIPKSRYEQLITLTGAGIAGLVVSGNLLVATRESSRQNLQLMAKHPEIADRLMAWTKSVFLIVRATKDKAGRGSVIGVSMSQEIVGEANKAKKIPQNSEHWPPPSVLKKRKMALRALSGQPQSGSGGGGGGGGGGQAAFDTARSLFQKWANSVSGGGGVGNGNEEGTRGSRSRSRSRGGQQQQQQQHATSPPQQPHLPLPSIAQQEAMIKASLFQYDEHVVVRHFDGGPVQPTEAFGVIDCQCPHRVKAWSEQYPGLLPVPPSFIFGSVAALDAAITAEIDKGNFPIYQPPPSASASPDTRDPNDNDHHSDHIHKVQLNVIWGYAGWDATQIVAEIARGAWGLVTVEQFQQNRDLKKQQTEKNSDSSKSLSLAAATAVTPYDWGYDFEWCRVIGLARLAPKTEYSKGL